jgi:hypothetical protein
MAGMHAAPVILPLVVLPAGAAGIFEGPATLSRGEPS